MNRREFTASLAAAVAAPALPLGATAAAPAAAMAPPMGTYMFADLIARSRGTVDAGFLARTLRLSPDMANGVMQELVANKVITAPSAGGLAQALNPLKLQPVPATVSDRMAEKVVKTARDFLTEDDAIEVEPVDPETLEDD